MLPQIPYLDVSGYRRRTKVAPTDVDMCVSLYPGYLEHRFAIGSSRINARLHKRYAVPLGQTPPTLVAVGTSPPAVTLTGRPTVGSFELVIQITLAGALGVATFQWSLDGGQTFPNAGTAAPSLVLPGTGLTVFFAATGPFALDNVYSAAAPVPEIALGWLVAMVDVDLWDRRGSNPQDPRIERALDDRAKAFDDMKEAADAKDGLFELPTNDVVGDDAVVQGGPLSYTEASPYVWMDQQRCAGRGEDRARFGTTGGS